MDPADLRRFAQLGVAACMQLQWAVRDTWTELRQVALTGTVEPGKAADLVLLDRDVTRCPVADISGTGVRLAKVGGRVVHDAESAAGRTAAARVARAASGPRPASYATVHGIGRHAACTATAARGREPGGSRPYTRSGRPSRQAHIRLICK
ncbi:hypothetical protein AB0B01_04090 [Streptomyces sp. NPDC044571]|uniref:hypothetical protein n=1 Tax=Streptomyces sp. NPDC044571 TaxID=3155371 RepID=UPI0033CF9203